MFIEAYSLHFYEILSKNALKFNIESTNSIDNLYTCVLFAFFGICCAILKQKMNIN